MVLNGLAPMQVLVISVDQIKKRCDKIITVISLTDSYN